MSGRNALTRGKRSLGFPFAQKAHFLCYATVIVHDRPMGKKKMLLLL